MRVKTVQINWHDKLPIFSVDFDHNYTNTESGGWRFATGGGDNNVRIWRLRTPEEREADAQQPAVEFLASLNRHAAPVNVVRFSPTSSRLASAGDDGAIILWRQMDEPGDEPETWRPASMLRGSPADICDLAWSPCGRYIASASVDNTVRIWDAVEARCVQVLADHSHYVQGVAWDPLGAFLVTQSSDRSMRTYRWHADVAAARKPGAELATQLSVHFSMPRVGQENKEAAEEDQLAAAEDAEPEMDVEAGAADAEADSGVQQRPAARRTQRLFHDDNLTSFFRRPAISPDGRLVATAAGVQRDKASRNTCFVWARDGLLAAPVLSLGGHAKPVVATRWAPCCFERRAGGDDWVGDGERGQSKGRDPDGQGARRMMLAVATQNSVALYDTSLGARAVGLMAGLHYAAITDVAWSCDGAHLVIASIDGFASVAAIDQPTLPVAAARCWGAADGVTQEVAPPPPAVVQPRDALALAAAEAAAAEAARLKGKKRLAPTFVSAL